MVNLDNKTDGGFWFLFWASIILVIITGTTAYFTGLSVLTILSGVITGTLIAFFALGAEVLEPNEIGVFTRFNKFPEDIYDLKFTEKGGPVHRNPLSEKIIRFDTGLFTLDIEYRDLTMLNGDNASGIVQLTLQIDVDHFETLFQITGGKLDRHTIEEKVKTKLNETVPVRLGMAIAGDSEIEEGYKFEEATKRIDKSFANSLKSLLTTHHDQAGNVDQYKTDCFGLTLKSVELPTPVITGTGYDAYKATKTSQASRDLSIAEAAEYNTFLGELIKKFKADTGLSENQSIKREDYLRLRTETERLLAQSKGNNPIYHEGLGGANSFVNV